MNRICSVMLRVVAAVALSLTPAGAARADWPAAWHEPTAPFHIVGNIYYVGGKGLAVYLITSPKGHILLDGTLAENVPFIERNIAALGFRLRDVKVLLNTHGHFDHAAGLAALRRDTGARLYASAAERPTLETGHIAVENDNGLPDFPPVHVDRVIGDGGLVRVGATTIKAILTPGHTPGCTSWATTAVDRGRTLRVVMPCSLTVAGNRLVAPTLYTTVVADFRHSFDRLDQEKADVVLSAHPEIADVLGRETRRKAGAEDAFVDTGLLHRLVRDARRDFEAELARQEAAARMPSR